MGDLPEREVTRPSDRHGEPPTRWLATSTR